MGADTGMWDFSHAVEKKHSGASLGHQNLDQGPPGTWYFSHAVEKKDSGALLGHWNVVPGHMGLCLVSHATEKNTCRWLSKAMENPWVYRNVGILL